MRKRAALFGFWVLGSGLVYGQSVPSYVNYQGRLTDAAGAPLVTRDYNLTFRVYDSASGGTVVWGALHFDVASGGTLTQGHKYKVPVVQGYFNVMLGDVDVSGRSVLTAFGAPARFVEVTVEDGCSTPPCAALSPRQQILSAPYAITAANGVLPGALFAYAGGISPAGFLLCDGTAVSRTTYNSLFAAIGTAWGTGDGSTTFNLPDLRGRTLVGAGQGGGLSPRVLAGAGGEEVHVLSVAEMPGHSHGVNDPGHRHEVAKGLGEVSGGYSGIIGPINFVEPPGTNYNSTESATGITLGSTGSGVAHNTMPPFAVVSYIIKY